MRWTTLLPLVALLVLAQPTFLPVAEAATFEVVPSASEARYRVREQLAGNNFPNDAVGTTQSVSGTIAFDAQGRIVPGSKITVDLRTLRSDNRRRDDYLRRNTLATTSLEATRSGSRPGPRSRSESSSLPSPASSRS